MQVFMHTNVGNKRYISRKAEKCHFFLLYLQSGSSKKKRRMNVVVRSVREYVDKVVDILSSVSPAECQLSPSERRFLIENAVLHIQGEDIGEKRAVDKLNKIFKWPDKSRNVYKGRKVLQDKKWLIKNGSKDFALPPMLQKVNEFEMTFRIKLAGNEFE